MPPQSSRDFQRVARQRLNTAEHLLATKYTLPAQYIGGYSVECSLKALILDLTPEADRLDKLARITAGATMHQPEVLLQELRTLGVRLPMELARRFRKFKWDTSLRYETGRRDTGETVAFLRTAKIVNDWVAEQLK